MDQFGYKIQLKFDNYGSTYRTVPGGLATLIMWFIVISLLTKDMLKVFNRQDNTVNES